MRIIAILRVVLVLATLTGATVIGVSTPASALPPTPPPCRPRWCDPAPEPDPDPGPPPTTAITVSDPLPSTLPQPVSAYDAQHVTTTIRIRREVDRASGAVLRAWINREYHVWNDWAFQGWHVSVREQLRSSEQTVWWTDVHVVGVTPAFWDPAGASVRVTYYDEIPTALADQLTAFVPEDRFTN
jgi:hypothetical protein